MTQSNQQILSELARVKALFQARTIAMHMGADPEGVRIVNGQIVERLRFIPVSGSPLEPSAGIVPGASRGGG